MAEGKIKNITPANIGARPETEPTSGNWFRGTPIISSDGVMEIGKYIDFHATDASTDDYDARITADTTGLVLSGTTTGTFSGSLTGNATNVTGIVAVDHGGTGVSATDAADLRSKLGIPTTGQSSLFPRMVYNLSSNIVQIAGQFTGNGSSTMALGIPSCTGTVLTRNTSNGKLELQYIHSSTIDTWDGVGGRVFDNGVTYQISGICSLD